MRYFIAPLDIKDDELLVYKYLYGKCDFITMICEYTERNIILDTGLEMSRKRLRKIIKDFEEFEIFTILELSNSRGKVSKLRINKDILWNRLGTGKEPDRNQLSIENTNFKASEEPIKNQLGTDKEPSIKEQRIKNNNISSKDDENSVFEQSNVLWSLYPKKEGKAIAIKKIPKLINQYSYEEIRRCIDRYVEKIAIEKTERQFIKNGSTFFNSGYVDFLDENYEKLELKKVAISNSQELLDKYT